MFAPLYGGNAWFAPPNDICLQCMRFPKRKNFTFCSKGCSDAVARDAPRLIKIPPNHVMHQNVKRDFESSWCAPNRPCILDIYLITWSASSRSSFDNYRDIVQRWSRLPNGNEVKRFRAERRACHLGEPGQLSLCRRHDCRLCYAIRTGFKSTLAHKRSVQPMGYAGIRLGHGIYATPTSSKAFQYATNTRDQSRVKTVIYSRVVLGKAFRTAREMPLLRNAPSGYDSVEALSGPESQFDDPECVVYNANAIRPAYLISLLC
ncbi:hypothetical protein M405DRAFT_740076 [Rhizopogon salebrosus TDB-379]|nr:hypothetical protein M405DRAFT_740076 [Rhizopogon salebrosus TDB-379]